MKTRRVLRRKSISNKFPWLIFGNSDLLTWARPFLEAGRNELINHFLFLLSEPIVYVYVSVYLTKSMIHLLFLFLDTWRGCLSTCQSLSLLKSLFGHGIGQSYRVLSTPKNDSDFLFDCSYRAHSAAHIMIRDCYTMRFQVTAYNLPQRAVINLNFNNHGVTISPGSLCLPFSTRAHNSTILCLKLGYMYRNL